MPFKHGGLGALLGGTVIIYVGELLEKFGAAMMGYYGAIPGFLIKIGALCLCLGYSSQVLRAVYMGSTEMPYWEISSLDFVDLIEKLLSILMSLIYGIIFTLIFYLISISISGYRINLLFFLTHLNSFGFLLFFSIFFPAIYFWHSLSPDDIIDTLNPVLVFSLIARSMPYYILLILSSCFTLWLFLYLRINLIIIGSFVEYFIKFYFLIFFSLSVAGIFRKTCLETNNR